PPGAMPGPAAPTATKAQSWAWIIAPYVEKQNVTYNAVLTVYNCPLDPRYPDGLFNPIDLHGYMSYMPVAGLSTYGSQGIMYTDSKISAVKITDGTSNTLLVAERPALLLGPNWGWGWFDSWDQGDVAIGLQNTDVLGFTAPCPTPQYFGPGADGADGQGYV